MRKASQWRSRWRTLRESRALSTCERTGGEDRASPGVSGWRCHLELCGEPKFSTTFPHRRCRRWTNSGLFSSPVRLGQPAGGARNIVRRRPSSKRNCHACVLLSQHVEITPNFRLYPARKAQRRDGSRLIGRFFRPREGASQAERGWFIEGRDRFRCGFSGVASERVEVVVGRASMRSRGPARFREAWPRPVELGDRGGFSRLVSSMA